MSIVESLKQAFESLKSNKLRTILTMIGIVMGIFSVITIVSIGNSAEKYLKAEFDRMGANVIYVAGANTETRLNLEDMELIKKAVPEMKNIKAETSGSGLVQLSNEDDKVVLITGVTSQHRSFSDVEIVHGRFINELDIEYATNNVVIDESSAKKLFKRKNVVGEKLEFMDFASKEKLEFKIVGVVKDDSGIFGEMLSMMAPISAHIPITNHMEFTVLEGVDGIFVTVENSEDLAKMGDRIVRALKFKNGNDNKYIAQNSTDIHKSIEGITNVLSGILLIIAVITLLVGGIGIVNILLVSVTERIREIGIRKALGAQKKDIVMQFLTESIIITLISGIIGIGLGLAVGAIISSQLNIPPVVDIVTIILTVIGSVVLGLIFGVYPAKKAADLDPIESLRYE